MDFNGKHIVITGGTGGLGQAVVEAFIDLGANLHIPCISNVEIDNFALNNHEQVSLTAPIDLTNENAVSEFYQSLPNIHASIHLAGGFTMGAITATSQETFSQQIDINATTCFLCCREAVTKFANQGGYIVNVAARPALEPRQGANMVAYTASKAAVAAITQSLAEEVIQKDIYVNAIAPSIIDTAANRAAMPDADFSLWVKPKDLAAIIMQLCSSENKVTRGAVVTVYGKS